MIILECTSSLMSHVEKYVSNGKHHLKAPTDIQENELYDLDAEDYQTPDEWWKDQFIGKDPDSLDSDWVGSYKLCVR